MPRVQNPYLTNILAGSHSRRDTLDLYLTNGTIKRLSRGAVSRGGNIYQDYIRDVGDLVKTETEVDRLNIVCQNINSELGLLAASDLRLLDYAVADYGRIYQSNVNPALVEDYPQIFRTVLASAQITETRTSFELINDFESLGETVASRGPKEKCVAAYKNGLECTSTSSELTCPKTRLACRRRGKEYQFLGFEFFEEPTDSAPGSAGNSGGIETGQGIGGCFLLDTSVRLASQDAAIGSLPLGKLAEPIRCYSFNKNTEEIEEDWIDAVAEYERTGFYTLEFEDGTLNVTEEHPLFRGLKAFARVGEWRLADNARFHVGEWKNSRLVSMKWNSDVPVKVRDITVRKNHTFFANNCAVSNKSIFEEYQS